MTWMVRTAGLTFPASLSCGCRHHHHHHRCTSWCGSGGTASCGGSRPCWCRSSSPPRCPPASGLYNVRPRSVTLYNTSKYDNTHPPSIIHYPPSRSLLTSRFTVYCMYCRPRRTCRRRWPPWGASPWRPRTLPCPRTPSAAAYRPAAPTPRPRRRPSPCFDAAADAVHAAGFD